MPNLPHFLSARETAFFFDFDGTLVELVATPGDVQLTPRVRALLVMLFRATGGAVALISGRGIDPLDTLLAPLQLPMAGLHGAERRSANGIVQRVGFDDARLTTMQQVLEETVRTYPGMLLENKGAALALHFRNALGPHALIYQAAYQATQRLVARYSDTYQLQPGKMVFEIKPKQVDKGKAIHAFLKEPPFAGRTPFFAGDDLTDEQGFVAVNEHSGYSVKIGVGDTVAHTRLASSEALLAWLESSVLPLS